MTIQVACACGKNYAAPDDSAGRSFPCKQCGVTLTVPGGTEPPVDAGEATRNWILEARKGGATRGALRRQLMEQGMSDLEAGDAIDDALGMLGNPSSHAATSYSRAAAASNGFPGWILWIGALIAINAMSAMFDWPFWVY